VEETYVINQLLIAFCNEEIKRQVLEPVWFQLNIETGIHSTGFCFSASEVIYLLTGGSEIWMVKSLKDPDQWDNGTHYFLMRKSDNEIIDITADQYTKRNITIPYQLAKGKGLRNISNKARMLARLAGLGDLN
jgi:hypothetical protein